MPGLFSREQIERHNAIVAKVRGEVDDGKDAQGFGDRIGQLHQRERGLLDLAGHPAIVRFLRWAFGDEPVVMGSLHFQKGTEQDPHIDAIFFWPEPAHAMAGVWIALEDVQADAGPLFYIPGSHRWPFYRSEDVVRNRPELAAKRAAAVKGELTIEERAALLSALGKAWTEDFLSLEREFAGKRIMVCPKAGDVVIWHSLLAHGGSPRVDKTLSRLSAVFHYFGASAKLFAFDQFMLYDNAELSRQRSANPPLSHHKELGFMRFPQFVTYSDGKELHHPVTD